MRSSLSFSLFVLFIVLCLVLNGAAAKSPLSFRFRPQPFLNPTKVRSVDVNFSNENSGPGISQLRGGGSNDGNPVLFLKIGASAVLETAALVGLFFAGKEVSDNSKIAWFWPKWISILFTVFGSSAVGSLIDGGMSAASKQASNPNAIPGDPDWYDKLNKPWWNPPGWVFPIMWLIVSKPTQAAALNTIVESKENIPWGPLAVYCAHLSLGDAWNKVFFGLQSIGRGAGVITGFFGSLLSSTFLFFRVDKKAGKLMLPTCGWVAVATALNWSIFFKNR